VRNWQRIAGVLTFVLLLPGARATCETRTLSGDWKGSFDFQGSSVPLTFHFTAAEYAVTGSVEGLPTTPAEIHDGKLDRNAVSFWVNTEYEGETYKLLCKGTVSASGDEIAFTLNTDDGSWGTQLTAKRSVEAASGAAPPAAPDVTGDWKGAFEFNGGSVPLTFHLKSADGVVTGTVEGLPTTPAEIHEGRIDGDTVTIWVSTDYQGQSYRLLYKGKIAAGQIDFMLGSEDGSWETQLTAAKVQ